MSVNSQHAVPWRLDLMLSLFGAQGCCLSEADTAAVAYVVGDEKCPSGAEGLRQDPQDLKCASNQDEKDRASETDSCETTSSVHADIDHIRGLSKGDYPLFVEVSTAPLSEDWTDERTDHVAMLPTYTAELTRNVEEHWGIRWDIADNALAVITAIDEGSPAFAWNQLCFKRHHKSQMIRVMDCLEKVNGSGGGAGGARELVAMLERSVGPLKVTLRHPQELQISVAKQALHDVVELQPTASTGLLVSRVDQGALKTSWGAVNVSDRVVAVNECRGDPEKLLETIEEEVCCEGTASLKLRFLSYHYGSVAI